MRLDVVASVDGAVSGTRTATFQVSRDGAQAATTVDPTTIAAALPAFGFEAFDGQVLADAMGTPLT